MISNSTLVLDSKLFTFGIFDFLGGDQLLEGDSSITKKSQRSKTHN